ncbi:hypothetical protein C4573_05295 [Candidatus Woesearchaeota archaeon]|nr:MAG: hypothetical protein C4573_05295 [Candidatus Woesearchaeota archaeon]
MKRKYTKEQLIFYFKKLAGQLNRIPTIEDLEKQKNFPSLTVYKERFGSWENVKKSFATKEMNKKFCKNCGKEILFEKQTKQFCSPKCDQAYLKKEKQKAIPPKQCSICKNPFYVYEVKNFKKRKICNKKECKEYFTISLSVKKINKLTKQHRQKLTTLKGNKCFYCDFDKILHLMTKNRHSEKKLVSMIKKKNFDFFLVCPNHKEMLMRKMI